VSKSDVQFFNFDKKNCQQGATLKLLRSQKFFQHRVFLSSVTRAALWSSRFEEKFSHVSLGHPNRQVI